MNKRILHGKDLYLFLAFTATCLLLSVVFPWQAHAQDKRAVDGERAICQVKAHSNAKLAANQKVDTKNYKLEPNQIGFFDRVSDIQPKEEVPIEVYYPDGKEGEKVVLQVKDGGRLDNGKRVKVMQLDKQKKLSFNFQVTSNLGMYRVVLAKGNDTKVVQLWVGAEPTVVQQ